MEGVEFVGRPRLEPKAGSTRGKRFRCLKGSLVGVFGGQKLPACWVWALGKSFPGLL